MFGDMLPPCFVEVLSVVGVHFHQGRMDLAVLLEGFRFAVGEGRFQGSQVEKITAGPVFPDHQLVEAVAIDEKKIQAEWARMI